MFRNFGTSILVSENNTAIFFHSKGVSGKVAQPISLIQRPRVDLRGNLVIHLFSSVYTFSETLHKKM